VIGLCPAMASAKLVLFSPHTLVTVQQFCSPLPSPRKMDQKSRKNGHIADNSPHLVLGLQYHSASRSWVCQMWAWRRPVADAPGVQIQFTCVASFWNEGKTKATAVENGDQICTPVKLCWNLLDLLWCIMGLIIKAQSDWWSIGSL